MNLEPVSGSGGEACEEISPVRSKMASLANRSSFTSFFLKNKNNLPPVKSDPAATFIKPDPLIKPDPSQEFLSKPDPLKEQNLVEEDEKAVGELILERGFKADPNESVFKVDPNEPVFKVDDLETIRAVHDVENIKTIHNVTPKSSEVIIENLDDDAVMITEIKKTPKRQAAKRRTSSEVIELSDSEKSVTVIESDIEIIAPRRSQRIKTASASADIECISISSDDGDKVIRIKDLRHSNRISGTDPSVPVIPLSDYSNMKKLNFSKLESPPKPNAKVILKLPTVNTVKTNVNVNVNVFPAENNVSISAASSMVFTTTFEDSPVRSDSPSKTGPISVPATTTASTKPIDPANNSVKPSVPVPLISAAKYTQNSTPSVTTVVASASNIIVPAPKPVSTVPVTLATTTAPSKPTTTTLSAPVNISVSPTKTKSTMNYMPANFMNLDPSLREELMSRLSQRSTAEVTNTTSTTAATTNITNPADEKYVLFSVVQRTTPGTFDPSKSLTGRIQPSSAFTIYWKCSETFGALKRKIASDLRVSPFDLVLTRGIDGSDQSELFDTTRPSTLNIVGKTLKEYSELQPQTKPVAKKPRKNAKVQPVPPVNNTIVTSTITPLPAPIPQTQRPTGIPQSLTHRLYLYTKSTYQHYKSLQKTKKQQVYDSLTFLQSAQEEMTKLTQESADNDDLFLENSALMSQSQSTPALITVNVKTASSRNQSHPVKISPSVTISDLLHLVATQNNIAGTRVVFDGDVLKNTQIIGDILEDDDMVEIK